jgi:peptide/nickel transport system ATP-binding protein
MSLDIAENEVFCLIGETGSGKTTLIRSILGLHPFQEGQIFFKGRVVEKHDDSVHRELRSNTGMVFQDPVASLSPFLTLGQSIEEPLRAKGIGRQEREEIVKNLAKQAGLSYALLQRRPSQASGGQNQRVCIARALSTRPDLLFLDEPFSALDAIVQKEVARLLSRVKEEHHLTYLLITHDLPFVKCIGTTVAVMYLGRMVERAKGELFFSNPCHPYSQSLLSSVLKPGIWQGKRTVLEGEIPSPQIPPSGCVFHPRCPRSLPECQRTSPTGKTVEPEHEVFCLLYKDH